MVGAVVGATVGVGVVGVGAGVTAGSAPQAVIKGSAAKTKARQVPTTSDVNFLFLIFSPFVDLSFELLFACLIMSITSLYKFTRRALVNYFVPISIASVNNKSIMPLVSIVNV